MNKTKRPLEGIFLSFLFALIVVLGSIFFIKRNWIIPDFSLPTLASDRGSIDHLFHFILLVTGIAFILVQGLTGYFIWHFSDPNREKAAYLTHSTALEVIWTSVTAVMMIIIGIWGLRVWRNIITTDPPKNAIVVEVTGQQFQWNFRYPGPDGKFGRTDATLISDDNPLGLDPKDPASKDDIVTQDELYLPVNVPVEVRIRSKDVIHSFFLPNFRVKQDAVPGMMVETWFTPTRIGRYDIACAQLCGLGHYKMSGILNIVSQQDFQNELKTLKTGMRGQRIGLEGRY